MPSIGRYEIQREIGRGAMGVAYLAHAPHLHRQVAVKTYSLPEGISEDLAREFHERFLREARAAAFLSHPGIVTIYDAGEYLARRLPYIVMEYRSPGYMSPEQVMSGALDGRSDLFGLAVVLYEALCGKRPFHGDDLVSLAYSIAHDTQVPLSRQLQGCPAGLDGFFDRALAKDPARPFPDGATFRMALLEAGKERSSDRMRQRVEKAATVGLASPGNEAVPLGVETRPVRSLDPGPPRASRGRFFALKLAAVALLAVGLATAAYLRLGGPPSLKAGQRCEPRAPQRAVAGLGRQGPSADDAMRQAGAAPQAGDVQQGKAAQQDKAVPQKTTTRKEVEPVARPPRVPRFSQVTVPARTEIRLTLDMPVGSSRSKAGETFTARVADPVVAGDRVAVLAGSAVHGRVSEAVPAKKGLSGKGGSLSLALDKVMTPAGIGAPMSAAMTSAATGSGKKTAKIIGGGAAGGAPLGRILGKESKDAAVGTAIGGAIAAGTRGEEVEFPAGSSLAIRIDQPLTISVGP